MSKRHTQPSLPGSGRARILCVAMIMLATGTTGCNPIVHRASEAAEQFAAEGLVGAVVDTSDLLVHLERTAFQPQHIAIGFNSKRYDPSATYRNTLQRRDSGPPLQRAYQIDLHLTTIRGNPVDMWVHESDLPVDAKGPRIPVKVTSFQDSEGQLPMAKVEVIPSDGIPRVFWFDYVDGNWRHTEEAR